MSAIFDPAQVLIKQVYQSDAEQILSSHVMEAFGSVGSCQQDQPISLHDMVERYRSGELAPKLN